jgi:ArsR family transcriptional regulator
MPRNTSIPRAAEKIGDLLQVIAPPPRIAILLAIGRQEACVCHLEAVLGWRQAYISQHLMALRGAEVLTDRRDGRYVYYKLRDASLLDLVLTAARLGGLPAESVRALPAPRTDPACECPHCAPALIPAAER